MTIYITPDNKLHDDDEGRARLLATWPADAVIATQEQIDEILNPPIPQDILIKNQIAALELTITNRRIRESILGMDNGWLANVNNQISAIRGQL